MSALPIRPDSAFDAAQMADYLRAAKFPLRLACNGDNGFPLVASHWFELRGGSLFLAIHESSKVAALLQKNPRCGFEIAADSIPYRGVRGQGTATLTRSGATEQLESLIARYLGHAESKLAQWLLSRAAAELVVRIDPVWLTGWDFSKRMTAEQ
jgi:nitroimidazol reductase NimA-like FMN-containing flavoprotein (pyridoxamine 5'-phosphate oxidase superfamily)